MKTFVFYPLFVIAWFIGLTILIVIIVTDPSNFRNWATDQVVLPYADINNNLISIHNIRNFNYTSTSTYTAAYYDKTFDLNKIKKVYYVVEPFSGFKGSAHTFLSFEFENDQFLAVSVEIRKEVSETFSAVKGLFNKYEIMYVIADERDAIKLRSNFRKDQVYVYPIKTTKEKTQALFLDMINRANHLSEEPEFYNTLTNTCTTNIVQHVNTITPKKVPLSFKVLLPAESDKLAYDLGLIDTDLPFEDARKKYLINDRAATYANDPAFSVKIRK
ncbi:DUF4105 domain-containing protein [Candidatus Parcubacteria bacterium]|nr:DUF4105 domain-containing protein [Candidatus Parcubacteria bacterium]